MDRVLFITTSTNQIGRTGKKTGAHFAEITHPYEVLKTAGFDIDFVSPRGGRIPLDHVDLDDSISEKWIHNDVFRSKIEFSMNPNQVVHSQYKAVFYPGGHGVMFDLPDHDKLSHISGQIYDAGGVIGAVCHGSAGLLNIKIDGGVPLLKGKEVTGFTNAEEVAVGLLDQIPFLLEDRLSEDGGLFSKAAPFERHVVVSERLVTGQNPASARAVGEEIRKLISKSRSAFINIEESTIAP